MAAMVVPMRLCNCAESLYGRSIKVNEIGFSILIGIILLLFLHKLYEKARMYVREENF